MKKQKHNILILGDQKCKNRDNFIFQTLMKHGRDGDFNITWVNQSYIATKIQSKKQNLPAKLWNRFIFYITGAMAFFRFIFLRFFSDLVILMPCSYHMINWVIFSNMFVKRPLLTDYYICAALMYEEKAPKYKESVYQKKLRLDKKIIEHSSIVIHLYKAEVRETCKRAGLKFPEEKIRIIPSCIPANPLSTRNHDDCFIIAWWGMIGPLHGLELLLDALLKVKSRINIKCYLFSMPYPEKSINELRSLISAKGLDDAVQLRTDCNFSNQKIYEYLTDKVDLALGHFSDSSDKARNVMCTKVVDAMSMRLPVLSRYTDAINELLNINDDIFVCDPTPDAIAEALIKIRDNPTERQRRAENGYIKWKSSFTQESFEDRFLDAVRQCIAMGK